MAENLDPTTIDELNNRFRELVDETGLVSKSFGTLDRQTISLTSSFAKLQGQIDANSRVDNDILKALKDRLKAEEEAAQAAKNIKTISAKSFNELVNASSGVDGALNLMQARLTDLAGNSKVLGVSLSVARLAVDSFIDILKTAYTAEINYTKAIVSGERGQQVVAKRAEEVGKAFNKAIDGIGNFLIGLGAVTALFGGPIGIAFGVVSAAAGVAAKTYAAASNAALEFQTAVAGLRDKLFQGFNDLAKASLAGAGGMTQLHRQLNTMQMSLAEVGDFVNIVKNAGKEIRLFAGRTTEGLDKFVNTAGGLIKSELGRTLEIMGITAQDQREHTLEYMQMQARFGLLQGKSVEHLSKSAGNYILEMDRLAELTGATRKEQEDARKQIMAIQELRAAMLLAKSPEEKEKLKFGLQTAEALSAAGLKGMGAGLARYVAGKGAITAESAPGFMAMPELFRATLAGKGTVAGNIAAAGPGLERFLTMAAQSARFNAEAVKDLIGPDGFGPGSELLIKLKQIPKEALANADTLKEYLSKNRQVVDSQTAAQVDLIRSQRNAAIMHDHAAGSFAHSVGLFGTAVDRLLGKGKSAGQVSLTQGEQAANSALNTSTELAMTGGSEAQVSQDIRAQQEAALRGKSERRKLRQQRTSDPLAGINFKDRSEATGGGDASPALITLAQRIADTFAGHTITGMNDLYHWKEDKKDSKHRIGKALDFTLANPPATAADSDAIVSQLMGMGASMVLDGYHRQKHGKGPHFHVEVAHGGGMFTGSMADFPVLLKNNEYVLTQSMVDNLRMQMGVDKTPIENVLPEATGGGSGTFGKLLQAQYEVTEKLDKMINVLESGVSIQDKMLRYARA